MTLGISPKAFLAAVLPTLGGFVAILVQWIATGALDRSELATAVGALLAAALAFIGAYAGDPGVVAPHVAGDSSDARLSVDAISKLPAA